MLKVLKPHRLYTAIALLLIFLSAQGPRSGTAQDQPLSGAQPAQLQQMIMPVVLGGNGQVVNLPPQILTGSIAFAKQVISDNVQEGHFALGADLDGDGDLDIAAGDLTRGLVLWFENDGRGAFTERIVDPDLSGAYPIAVGDVDGDGLADILAGGYEADTFTWYKYQGQGSFARQLIDDNAAGAHSIVTADLDQDGDTDLVTSAQDHPSTIAWYENDGAQNFALHVIYRDGEPQRAQAKRAEVADMDNDGDLDVVTASFRTNEITLYENDGAMQFTRRVVSKAIYGAYFVTPVDLDGDLDLDLVTASQNDDGIAWLRNDRAAGFRKQSIDGEALGARAVFPADLDRDGDIDVLSSSVDDDTIGWYINDGSGSFAKSAIDTAVSGAYGVFAVDMDSDGNLDVITVGRDDNTVALHTQYREHTAAVPAGETLLLDDSLLLTVDANHGPRVLIYTMVETPVSGDILLGGAPLPPGGTFTQEDLNNGRVSYAHIGSASSVDSFAFTVASSGAGDIQPATATFTITVE